MRQYNERDEAILDSPIGRVRFTTDREVLVSLDFVADDTPLLAPASPFGREVDRQLQGYFSDPTWSFTLPMKATGSPFQHRVWKLMAAIEPGKRRSYGDLAAELGSAARAVGGACRANPLLVIVPCHRVVAARGGLGGFSGAVDGAPLERKRWLLDHEAAIR